MTPVSDTKIPESKDQPKLDHRRTKSQQDATPVMTSTAKPTAPTDMGPTDMGQTPGLRMNSVTLTILWTKLEQQEAMIKSLQARVTELENGKEAKEEDRNVWQVESLNAKQKTEIWHALEPKIEEKVKVLVADKAINAIAKSTIDSHVQKQTQEVAKLAQQFTEKTERGNAQAEKVLRMATASNVRIINVGAEYRINNRAKLVQKSQTLIREVNKLASVVDAKYYTTRNVKGDKQVPQTHLVVTLQGPAAVAETIAGARTKRKEFFHAKEGKGKEAPFPYCDRDLTPEMLRLRQRMEKKLDEWRSHARPANAGKDQGFVDIGAWIDYREGQPVLLKRNKAEKRGDPRGVVEEWIWKPLDTTKPEVGEFIVAPKRMNRPREEDRK